MSTSQLSKGFLPRKSFSQNFLCDAFWLNKIASTVGAPDAETLIVEIGPGQGALTRALLQAGHKVLAIEVDKRLEAHLLHLQSEWPQGQLSLLFADALTFKFQELPAYGRYKLVSNLPYHIAGPLTAKLLTAYASSVRFESLTLLMQKEMALRLMAQPSTKAYGRLSVLVQLLSYVQYVGTLKAELFRPKPEVDSSLVHCVMKAAGQLPNRAMLVHLHEVLFRAFSQRRKMLRSSISSLIEPAFLPEGFNERKRAEDLLPEEFLALALAREKSLVAAPSLSCAARSHS